MAQCLVVMQPTFLPWAGYFNLIAQTNDFVFLDDVQLEKQSWQTRNQLIISKKSQWIVVPIRSTHLAQSLAETEVVDSTRWRVKLAKSVEINYGRHPYYSDAKLIVEYLMSLATVRLAEINEMLICWIVERLQLTARIHYASALNVTGDRSERLIALCQYFGATEYLSPVGAKEYLEADGFAARTETKLNFQNYIPQPYQQKGMTSYHSHLSIVDVIANIGWDRAKEYVQKGV